MLTTGKFHLSSLIWSHPPPRSLKIKKVHGNWISLHICPFVFNYWMQLASHNVLSMRIHLEVAGIEKLYQPVVMLTFKLFEALRLSLPLAAYCTCPPACLACPSLWWAYSNEASLHPACLSLPANNDAHYYLTVDIIPLFDTIQRCLLPSVGWSLQLPAAVGNLWDEKINRYIHKLITLFQFKVTTIFRNFDHILSNIQMRWIHDLRGYCREKGITLQINNFFIIIMNSDLD